MWRNQYGTIQGMLSQPRQYCRRMVAMSNARGGMILFGIKDKTGEIIGLSYQEIQQLNSILANIATNLLRPVIYIQTETVIVDERSLLIAHIAEGDNKPYKDLNGIIWTKQRGG